MKIYLKKDLVKELDTDALLAYIALRSIYHKGEEEFYVSVNMLCYRLVGDCSYTRTFKSSIVNGFNNLVCRNLVVVKEQISKTEFIVNGQGLYFDDDYFVGIDLEYIRLACSVGDRIDRGGLVKYLLMMVGTFNNDAYRYQDCTFGGKKGFVGFMPIGYIAQEAGISEQTALSYNTILEDNNIIYVYRHGYTYYDEVDECLKTINNNYGLYEDRKEIIRFGDNVSKMHGFESKTNMQKKANANRCRSLAAKYRAMCNGKEYSTQEMQEIYEYINSRTKE
jgi:hypothetical protein